MTSVARNARITRAMVLVLGLLASCASRTRRYEFVPDPAEIVVQAMPDAPTLARLLVSVPGAIREDGRNAMRVRVRVENRSDQDVRLEVDRWLLIGSDLLPFGAPTLVGGEATVAPRSVEIVNLDFPFREGVALHAPRLRGVNLQWVVTAGGLEWESSLTLDRQPEYRDYGYPGYENRFFIGVGLHHHH